MLYREGRNLAEASKDEYDSCLEDKRIINEGAYARSKSICVFISHKSCDKSAAEYIAKYIREYLRMDVYLDKWDVLLQQSECRKDDSGIVKCIHKGLDISTHLLCLLSNDTETSWWVPYEIGYADKSGISIATAQLANVKDVPSYLKINTHIENAKGMAHWISSLPRYGAIIESARISSKLESELSKFFD